VRGKLFFWHSSGDPLLAAQAQGKQGLSQPPFPLAASGSYAHERPLFLPNPAAFTMRPRPFAPRTLLRNLILFLLGSYISFYQLGCFFPGRGRLSGREARTSRRFCWDRRAPLRFPPWFVVSYTFRPSKVTRANRTLEEFDTLWHFTEAVTSKKQPFPERGGASSSDQVSISTLLSPPPGRGDHLDDLTQGPSDLLHVAKWLLQERRFLFPSGPSTSRPFSFPLKFLPPFGRRGRLYAEL